MVHVTTHKPFWLNFAFFR